MLLCLDELVSRISIVRRCTDSGAALIHALGYDPAIETVDSKCGDGDPCSFDPRCEGDAAFSVAHNFGEWLGLIDYGEMVCHNDDCEVSIPSISLGVPIDNYVQ